LWESCVAKPLERRAQFGGSTQQRVRVSGLFVDQARTVSRDGDRKALTRNLGAKRDFGPRSIQAPG
jgi:hypothetical protein